MFPRITNSHSLSQSQQQNASHKYSKGKSINLLYVEGASDKLWRIVKRYKNTLHKLLPGKPKDRVAAED